MKFVNSETESINVQIMTIIFKIASIARKSKVVSKELYRDLHYGSKTCITTKSKIIKKNKIQKSKIVGVWLLCSKSEILYKV